jgi:hypothetical protein
MRSIILITFVAIAGALPTGYIANLFLSGLPFVYAPAFVFGFIAAIATKHLQSE